ncbi:jg3211, partial [Pararge aegeria aegeria]
MEHARPPADLVLEGGPASRADAWRKWYKQFNVFLKASGVHKETKDIQASLLINLVGPDGYDIYSTFKFSKDENQDDIDVLVTKFNEYFGTKHSTTMARFRFFTRNQEVGENIDAYVTALRILSQHCEFEHLEDGLIRDRIVCGVSDNTVRDRLLRTDNLTLEKAMKICHANEVSLTEGKQIEVVKSTESSAAGAAVDALFNARSRARAGGGGAAVAGRLAGASGARIQCSENSPGRRFDSRLHTNSGLKCCVSCGIDHVGQFQCPAKFVKCFICNRRGHFKRFCPVKFNNKVFEVSEEFKDDLFYVSTLDDVNQNLNNKWFETLFLCKNGMAENFKLDSGSDLNVLSLKTFKKLGYSINDLKPCELRAQSFCGNYLPILGALEMPWLYKHNKYIIKFIISKDDCQSVLGKDTCENIGVIKRIFAINIDTYSDLFRGVGKLPGKYRIIIDKEVCPSICPVRKIPIGVRDKLKGELNNMEQMGIIRKVSHPTPWVNAIVLPAKKDGSVRVCLDPRPLNRAIRRAHYPLPTLTEIATALRGAKYFSKLDARSGFWMVQLDDQSADLCTFGTPFGRYQFLRLPYGVSCASEVFHAKIRQILEDLEGVESFIDDIIVYGSTIEEHDIRLRRLLDRAREVGIRFNREKCEFHVQQVTYLGHTFSEKGMQIDKNKLLAIKDMPCPCDRGSLERFLGMTNYLSKFIADYANIASPLRSLLRKGIEWYWDSNHAAAVSALKEALCRAPVLALYSADEPVLLTVDASASALGAALLQAGRPVEFASVTLSETQTRYAQIEKELLAIVFALERFHQYVYGRSDVTIETDHKPLETLFKKSLDGVPARLQRMMLRIQCYTFNVIYKPGKYMYLADTLSRAALEEPMDDKLSSEIDAQACFIINNVPFSDSKIQSVRNATGTDPECKILVNYVLFGWPRYRYDADHLVRAHWSYRTSFEYIGGVLFKDNLVFIPRKLRGVMLERVHEGHLGIDRCKRRARDVMFWNGMSRDVEQKVRTCAACAEHAARPARESMISHSIPNLPWRKVGSDIFLFRQKYFLILVDYFSNFIEVSPISNAGSRAVILAMKEQFARHGIVDELITDNGPAYSSKEFRQFSVDWCFRHTTTSPNYAQANGLSERAVQTVKNIIKKSIMTGSDFYLGLLNFRSTPRDGVSSPAQLLMGRRLNTRLPVHINKLMPERNNNSDYININNNRLRAKLYYDRQSRDLPELNAGEPVVVL